MEKFIITTDADTKDLLIQEGFILLQEHGIESIFLNNSKRIFSGDQKKILYTSRLCL